MRCASWERQLAAGRGEKITARYKRERQGKRKGWAQDAKCVQAQPGVPAKQPGMSEKLLCWQGRNPLPDAKFIIKTETGCTLGSNSSKRSRFLLQEKRNAVSARPKTFPAPKTKERKDPPSQKLSAMYQKRGSGNQLAGAETGRKRPWGVSRSCCAMDRESSGAPGSAVRSTETPF